MRIFRRLIMALFLVSLVLYLGVYFWESRNTDTSGPEITSSVEVLELSVSDGEDALLAELSAYDDKDGDLTDDIMLRETSFFVEPGEFTAEYVVFDSDGNSAVLSRKVCYTDYTSPVFSTAGSLYFVSGTSADIMDSISASDVLDGDLSDRIDLVSGSVDTDAVGQYLITIAVTNSYGDRAEVQTYVLIGETRVQYGVILTDSFAYLDVGDTFDPSAYIQSYVDTDGEELEIEDMALYRDEEEVGTISTNGRVDTETAGNYLVEYTWSDEADSDGEEDEDGEDIVEAEDSMSVWLTVIVRE